VLTFNRGTFLVLGLQFFLLYFIPETRKKILIIVTLGLIGVIYFNKLVFLYLDRFIGGQGSEAAQKLIDKSAYYRFEAWAVGVKMLFLYPLGIGAGGFQYGWEKYGSDPKFYLGTPHQLFLTIGVDYGLPALIVFITILVTAITYSNKLSKTIEEKGTSIFKFLTISLISYVAYGMVTVGELSHLTGFMAPNNGYTIVLMCVLAIISFRMYIYKLNQGIKNNLNI
jgi:O-antigen ligase